MNDDGFIPGIIIGLMIALAVSTLTYDITKQNMRDDAVKHGKAEYYIEADTYAKKWRWKD